MKPVVAHLVSPYLFLTGGWIHTQLVHNAEFRPIVLAQGTENLEHFPFDPVYDLRATGLARFAKYLLGHYPERGYREVLEREGAAVLHAHMGWEGARAIRLADRPRRPFVVSFYGRDAGLLPRNPYWRVLYTRLFARADLVVAEGPFMAETLARIGAPRDRIRVVHLGIPLERFPFEERRPGPNETVVGLIAASFREKKGIAYALRAFLRIAAKHPRVALRVIGDGPLRVEIEGLARELPGRITLLGYQPPSTYCGELQRAHFFVAPSVTARDGDCEGGAPVCLLEAQASGLPVIATTHCDIPEVTRPGESALLAPERDVEGLAARMDALLSDPDRWPAMGRAGRAHVEAEFDIARQVTRMNALYREIL